jgi:hypothetical protein
MGRTNSLLAEFGRFGVEALVPIPNRWKCQGKTMNMPAISKWNQRFFYPECILFHLAPHTNLTTVALKRMLARYIFPCLFHHPFWHDRLHSVAVLRR